MQSLCFWQFHMESMHSWLPGFHFQCICFIYAGFPHLITVNNITVCPLSFSSLWRKYHRLIWIHPVSKLSSPLPTQQGLRLVHHCAPWLCHLISLHQVSLSCGLACVYWKHVVSQTKNRKETLGIVNIAVLSRINIQEMNKTQLIQHEKIYSINNKREFFCISYINKRLCFSQNRFSRKVCFHLRFKSKDKVERYRDYRFCHWGLFHSQFSLMLFFHPWSTPKELLLQTPLWSEIIQLVSAHVDYNLHSWSSPLFSGLFGFVVQVMQNL